MLRLVVQHFIDTAAPVGSRVLVEEHELDWSSASVRSTMHALEEAVSVRWKPRRVLLVEDDADLSRVLMEVFGERLRCDGNHARGRREDEKEPRADETGPEELREMCVHFNELATALPGHISRSTLSDRLRRLEDVGVL